MDYESKSFLALAMKLSALMLLASLPADACGSNPTYRRFEGLITDVAANGAILFPQSVQRPTGQVIGLDAFGGGTVATEISNDGNVLAGHGVAPGAQYYRGWIKRGDGPYIDLGTLGGDRAVVHGMSGDGKFVGGVSYNAHAEAHAFRWSQQKGMQLIDSLPLSNGESISGMSADGKTMAGTAYVVDDRYDPGYVDQDCAGECGPLIASYRQAFIWTEGGGTMPLGSLRDPPPSNDPTKISMAPYDTSATAISADGRTIVGYANAPGMVGFIWRAETGMQILPSLPTYKYSPFFPLALSGDGSIVVGRIGGSCGTDCFAGPGAVIWDAQNGTRLLKSVLVDTYGLGSAIGQQPLEQATYISDDGLTIAGLAERPSNHGSWLVTMPSTTIPEPTTVTILALGLIAIASCRRSRP